MTTKKKLEDAMRKAESKMIAIARRREYFPKFASKHNAFLAGIVSWYKRNELVPNHPVFSLPMYYEDSRDKEIAAVSASLLAFGANYDELHHLIGEHPWKWFVERNFVLLSLGSEQDKSTSGCANWRLSSLMDNFLKIVKKYDSESIMDAISKDAWNRGVTIEGSVLRRYKDEGSESGRCSARLLMLAMSDHDILGQGLWNFKEPLNCPFNEEIENYLRMWIPDVSNYGTVDDCVPLFGLDAGDFLLSYFGYFELGRIMPRDLRRYATRFGKWYKDGNLIEGYRWKRVLPKIPE